MATNFLEQLVSEWYEYSGYFVRRNALVGKRPSGGYECELDVVAFHPGTKHLVHIEPSTDAASWEVREQRYKKKFDAGKKYIPAMFPDLLSASTVPEQIALLVFTAKDQRRLLAGGRIVHISEFLVTIIERFLSFPMMAAQVPEQFPLLRTLQFVVQYRNELFKSEAKATKGKKALGQNQGASPDGKCLCGCGKPVKKRFLPGHDARYYSMLRWKEKELKRASIAIEQAPADA